MSLQKQINELQQLHAKLSEMYSKLLELHVDFVETLDAKPNTTVYDWALKHDSLLTPDEWGSNSEWSSPFALEVKKLAEITDNDFEGDLYEVKEEHEALLKHKKKQAEINEELDWQPVFNETPSRFVNVFEPEYKSVIGNKKARIYVTKEEPYCGYFELEDGSVYKFVTKYDIMYLTKLDKHKIYFREETPDNDAECRVVKMR